MAELVLALDVPTRQDVLQILEQMPHLRWVKVGPILMTREGPQIVEELIDRGLRVFLDLKWHDIPNTVAGAVTAARAIGASMATVHTLGGKEMMQAAVEASRGELALVGVTVLTSHTPASYAIATGRHEVDLTSEVERQGLIAAEAGLHGVVCSPHEVSLLRRRLGPEPYIVVPGIRRGSDALDDQVRVASARNTVLNGATHLVVGRPVLQAADPAAVFEEFMKEAQCIGS
jgi:orotidine-5'-phosphate decarboxylase